MTHSVLPSCPITEMAGLLAKGYLRTLVTKYQEGGFVATYHKNTVSMSHHISLDVSAQQSDEWDSRNGRKGASCRQG